MDREDSYGFTEDPHQNFLHSPEADFRRPNDAPFIDMMQEDITTAGKSQCLIRVFVGEDVYGGTAGFVTLKVDPSTNVGTLKTSVIEKLKQKRLISGERQLVPEHFNLACKIMVGCRTGYDMQGSSTEVSTRILDNRTTIEKAFPASPLQEKGPFKVAYFVRSELNPIQDDKMSQTFSLLGFTTKHSTFLSMRQGNLVQSETQGASTAMSLITAPSQGCIFLSRQKTFLSATKDGIVKGTAKNNSSRWFVEEGMASTIYLRSSTGLYLTANADGRVYLDSKGAWGQFSPVASPTKGYLKHREGINGLMGSKFKEKKLYFELNHDLFKFWKSARHFENGNPATMLIRANQVEVVRQNQRQAECFSLCLRPQTYNDSTTRELHFTANSVTECKMWLRAFNNEVVSAVCECAFFPRPPAVFSNPQNVQTDDTRESEGEENKGNDTAQGDRDSLEKKLQELMFENGKMKEKLIAVQDYTDGHQGKAFARLETQLSESNLALCTARSEQDNLIFKLEEMQDKLKEQRKRNQSLLARQPQGEGQEELASTIEGDAETDSSANESLNDDNLMSLYEGALQGEVENAVGQGWLKKKGAKGIHWQTRYFVLALFEAEEDEPEQALLLYYRSIEQAKEDIRPGVIQLSKVTNVEANLVQMHRWTKRLSPRILITVRGGRVYELLCPSVEVAYAWQAHVAQYLPAGVIFTGSLIVTADKSADKSTDKSTSRKRGKSVESEAVTQLQRELAATKNELEKVQEMMKMKEQNFEDTIQRVTETAKSLEGGAKSSEGGEGGAEHSEAMKQLTADLSRERAEVGRQKAEVARLNEIVASSSGETVQKHKDAAVAKSKELKVLRDAFNSMQKQREMEREKNGQYFQMEIEQLEGRLKIMSVKFEEMATSLDEAVMLEKGTSSQLDRAQKQVAEREEKICALQITIQSLETQLMANKNRNNTKDTAQLEEWERSLKEKEDSLDAKEKWLEEADKALDTQCKDFNRKIQEYNKRVISLNKRQANWKSHVKKLKTPKKVKSADSENIMSTPKDQNIKKISPSKAERSRDSPRKTPKTLTSNPKKSLPNKENQPQNQPQSKTFIPIRKSSYQQARSAFSPTPACR